MTSKAPKDLQSELQIPGQTKAISHTKLKPGSGTALSFYVFTLLDFFHNLTGHNFDSSFNGNESVVSSRARFSLI